MMNIKTQNKVKIAVSMIVIVILGCFFSIAANAYVIWHNGLKSIPSDIYIASHTNTNERNRTKDAISTWIDGCFAYDYLGYCPYTEYDFQSIMLHELEHVLGLDHSPDKMVNGIREPMYAYTNAGEMHRVLTNDDKLGIFSIY